VKYSTVYKFLLFILVLISFNFFRLTPLNDIENLFVFGFTIIGIFQFIIYYKYINISIRSWIWIFSIVAFIAIINSHLKLNQDFVSSIIPNLSFIYIFSVIPAYFLLNKIKTLEDTISKYFMLIAWAQLLFFAIIFFLNITLTYKSLFTGSVLEINAGKISQLFIQWAIFFYFLKFIKSTNFLYLALSLLFFILPALPELQRMHFLFTIIVFLPILFRYKLRISTSIAVFFIVAGSSLASHIK